MTTVGIIGSGPAADVHQERYAELGGVEVLRAASADVTDRVREVLDGADAVDVCSPTDTHLEIVEEALDRGSDVICRPPMGSSLDDAAAIASAAARSDAHVLAGHVTRFSPGHRDVYASVREGRAGEPGVVRVTRSMPSVRSDEHHDWYADDGDTGDILADAALHDFDYLRWLVGDVDRVFTRLRDDGDVEHAVTLVGFTNGAKAHVETSRGSIPGLEYRTTMDVAGDEGLVQYDTAEAAAFELVGDAGGGEAYGEPPLTDGDGRDGYHHMLDHFVSCVEGRDRPEVTAADGLAALELATAARQSVEHGRPVTVEEVAP